MVTMNNNNNKNIENICLTFTHLHFSSNEYRNRIVRWKQNKKIKEEMKWIFMLSLPLTDSIISWCKDEKKTETNKKFEKNYKTKGTKKKMRECEWPQFQFQFIAINQIVCYLLIRLHIFVDFIQFTLHIGKYRKISNKTIEIVL